MLSEQLTPFDRESPIDNRNGRLSNRPLPSSTWGPPAICGRVVRKSTSPALSSPCYAGISYRAISPVPSISVLNNQQNVIATSLIVLLIGCILAEFRNTPKYQSPEPQVSSGAWVCGYITRLGQEGNRLLQFEDQLLLLRIVEITVFETLFDFRLGWGSSPASVAVENLSWLCRLLPSMCKHRYHQMPSQLTGRLHVVNMPNNPHRWVTDSSRPFLRALPADLLAVPVETDRSQLLLSRLNIDLPIRLILQAPQPLDSNPLIRPHPERQPPHQLSSPPESRQETTIGAIGNPYPRLHEHRPSREMRTKTLLQRSLSRSKADMRETL